MLHHIIIVVIFFSSRFRRDGIIFQYLPYTKENSVKKTSGYVKTSATLQQHFDPILFRLGHWTNALNWFPFDTCRSMKRNHACKEKISNPSDFLLYNWKMPLPYVCRREGKRTLNRTPKTFSNCWMYTRDRYLPSIYIEWKRDVILLCSLCDNV